MLVSFIYYSKIMGGGGANAPFAPTGYATSLGVRTYTRFGKMYLNARIFFSNTSDRLFIKFIDYATMWLGNFRILF